MFNKFVSTKKIYQVIFVTLTIVTLLSGCSTASLSPITQDTEQPATAMPSEGLEPGVEISDLNGVELLEGEDSIILVEEIVIILLLIATLVSIAAQWFRVPYMLGLVVIGLVLTLIPQFDINISPSLILGLLVPPLIFEAAFHLNVTDLRRDIVPIIIFAVPGVILTMVIVGGLVSLGTGISITFTLVFGAIVAAIDPVAVIALFRTIGVPKRLEVLLEGESLLNDGTSVVLFGLVASIAISNVEFNLLTSVIDFIRIAGGGVIVGLILGSLISQLINRIDDYLIEITLTTILAYGSFLIAEEAFHVSGILAVVGAGLVVGNTGPAGMSPTTKNVLFTFWEYISFLVNSFIFLLIGLQIELSTLFASWQVIIIAIIAVLIARAVTIYGFAWVGRGIPLKWQHVLNWGGLRGAISLALALSLPFALGEVRTQLQVMTFGVVIFTLLVQGLTVGPFVRMLGITERSEIKDEYERRHARAVATRASYDHLAKMRKNGLISEHTWQTISPAMAQHNQALVEATREVLRKHPELEEEEIQDARRESLNAQRSTISILMKEGIISNEIYDQLVSEIDAALTSDIAGWSDMIRVQSGIRPQVDRLLSAVIQERDLENALSSLTKLGFSVTHLPSSGGFLGRRNLILLIGLAEGQEKTAVEALSNSCKKRVDYLSPLLENNTIPLPAPIPVDVGGATIFIFEIERYEEF